MLRPKSILTVEGISKHLKSLLIINGVFVNLSKFWKLMHAPSSVSKTNFVWLIARKLFVWHSNTLQLEKHCKQYQQKLFC